MHSSVLRSGLTSTRANAIASLRAGHFDVFVIGGGITGAGVARDAALRGLRVALVEQHDFASGTSSRSSRLVHGGVRYLEHGALRMVFESSAERRTLLRIAPHLVRPLAFTWPVYHGARIPRWKLALGLTAYDALALFRNVGRHEGLSARAVIEREPRLRADGLTGGARYWDAATDDVRLTLANVRSAELAGAVVLNHARVVAIAAWRAGSRAVHIRDETSNEAIEVRARVVVSAAGPWSDGVERLVHADAPRGVRGSKGVHVSVARERVGNLEAVTLLAPQDGRVMFVLPAGEQTIIGTTDSYDAVAPEDVRATERDVAYLLDAANHHFPTASLTRADVIAAWAGLRPLAAGDDTSASGTSGASRSPIGPGSASREHAIAETAPGFVRVTGGKLTTYRSMAQEVVDVVQRALGARVSPCVTATEPLHGGDIGSLTDEIALAVRACGDDRIGARLVRAHGSDWRGVWSLAERDSALRRPVISGRAYTLAELRWGILHEFALTLADLLVRRTPIAFELRDNGRAAARDVAPLVGRWLGWSEAETAAALTRFDAEVARMFGVDA